MSAKLGAFLAVVLMAVLISGLLAGPAKFTIQLFGTVEGAVDTSSSDLAGSKILSIESLGSGGVLEAADEAPLAGDVSQGISPAITRSEPVEYPFPTSLLSAYTTVGAESGAERFQMAQGGAKATIILETDPGGDPIDIPVGIRITITDRTVYSMRPMSRIWTAFYTNVDGTRAGVIPGFDEVGNATFVDWKGFINRNPRNLSDYLPPLISVHFHNALNLSL